MADGDRNREPVSEIGTILRETREAAGYGLHDVSQHLHIRQPYLEAIESGAYDSLPAPTYAIGFVRTYAQFLGLNSDRAVALLKSETTSLNKPRMMVFPSPPPEGKVPGGAIMFVAAVVALLTYGGWYYIALEGPASDLIPDVPASLQSWFDGSGRQPSSDEAAGLTAPAMIRPTADILPPENAVAAGLLPVQQPTPDRGPAVAATAPRPPDSAAPSNLEPAQVASREAVSVRQNVSDPPLAERRQPAADAGLITGVVLPSPRLPEPASAARLAAATADPKSEVSTATPEAASAAQIVLRAEADSWVRIRASDSTTIMARTMHRGDVYEVPARAGLRMTIGNAGGLTVVINGEWTGTLGQDGEVIRNIALDPATLRQRGG